MHLVMVVCCMQLVMNIITVKQYGVVSRCSVLAELKCSLLYNSFSHFTAPRL